MTNEVIRIIADWLAGEHAAAVNTLIPLVDRDAGDDEPKLVTIYDASRKGWVARRALPREGNPNVQFPHLTVMLFNDLELDGEVQTTYRDARARVLITYAHRELDTQEALTEGGYVLRAILQSLTELHHPAQQAARTRNGVCLTECTGIREVPLGVLRQMAIDTPITAALDVSYAVRDLEPRMGSSLLHAYQPGDSLVQAGATFTRSTTATYEAEV